MHRIEELERYIQMSVSPQLHIREYFARFLEGPYPRKFSRITSGAFRRVRFLDFKEAWPEKSEIAKHILAFANSGTGCLVIGVAEKEDNTYDIKGLSTLTDKTQMKDSLQKFLPKTVSYNIFDFEYDAAEYQSLRGKKFQLLLVMH